MANNIVPTDGLELDLGTVEKPWRKVIARSADFEVITGDLTGNADTATNALNDEDGNNIVATYLPAVTGAVVAFAGNTLPDGWLLCDGSAVDRTLYAALFTAIGTTYGSGDGSTTFNLPNLTDRFIEGSATSGTVKSAGLPNITGDFGPRGNVGFGAGDPTGAFGLGNTYGTVVIGTESSSYHVKLKFNASNSNSIYGNSTTVQPPAVTMRYIIKY